MRGLILILFISLFSDLKGQIGLDTFFVRSNMVGLNDTLIIYSTYKLFHFYPNICGRLDKVEDSVSNNTLHVNIYYDQCYALGANICTRLDTFLISISDSNLTALHLNWFAKATMCSQFPERKTDSAILLLNTTSINEIKKSGNFSVFPNPVTDQLIITSVYGSHPEQIWLYDIHGKLVKKELNTTQNLNMQDLTRGIYFLQIKFKDGVERLKIVKD